jgi:hopanoid biosynthesis associated radical SAM protein HpnH
MRTYKEANMSIPLKQQIKVGSYILWQRLRGNNQYPLVLMLEPLFQCNLACAGCGKIDYPPDILKKRMSVEDALKAVDECAAPIVSIPGGEPLIHDELPQIVQGIIDRKKFVYVCTNALLLEKKMHLFTPSTYLTFSVHLDGDEDRHDESVCREGVFEKAVKAIKAAKKQGFRVNINSTLYAGEDPERVANFFDYVTELGIDGITVSPGYSYQHAPKQDVFMGRTQSKELFRSIFQQGKKRNASWPLSHSTLFLDFLAGNQSYQCTPWSNPTYNIFGWQKPCYLLVDEGYASSYAQLLAETPWENYGVGRNPKCDNCMAHCGYEGTAINDMFASPLKSIRLAMSGPKTSGDMAPEMPILYTQSPQKITQIPIETEKG